VSTHLIGGGWSELAVYTPFLAEVAGGPVACVVLDEGDGPEQYERWRAVLPAGQPFPVLVPLGATLDPARLGDSAGVLVCGGLTPAYAAAVAHSGLAEWVRNTGSPYCGFSAGAAVAARRAVVGGWRDGEVPVCPEDAGEDLDQVTVVPGLGLVEVAVDVHCAQWGTLPRLIAAVRGSHALPRGLAIDEDTVVTMGPGEEMAVRGRGRVYEVTAHDVRVHTATPL